MPIELSTLLGPSVQSARAGDLTATFTLVLLSSEGLSLLNLCVLQKYLSAQLLFIIPVYIVPGEAVVAVHVLMLRADFVYVYSTTVRYQ